MKIIALFFFFFPTFLLGQQENFLLTFPERFIIDTYTLQTEGYFHTSFKPVIKSTIEGYSEIDKRIFRTGSDSAYIAKKKHSWFWRKLLTESLVDAKKDKFSLRVDPLFNFEYGWDTLGRMTVNSRGVVISGDLSDKFSFTTGVLETQTFPEKYVSNYIKSRSVAPGQGRARSFNKTGYDYSYSFGNISYSPSSHFNFQLGHGKQFLGDGYRSLLLSDVPFYYPYLRVTTTFKRFQYVNLWTAFQEVKPYDTRTLVYQRKHGSFTFLSYLLSKKIELGLFEAILFQSTDSNSNNILPIDVANPVIGIRTLQYGYRYKHNALLGLTAKVSLFKHVSVYGQFACDDFNRNSDSAKTHNRFAYQAGLKFLQQFKNGNLFLLSEFNHINKYTYCPTVTHQSYSAFNEPLAHPLGADVNELVLLIRYSYKDFFIQLKLTSVSTIAKKSIVGRNILEDIDYTNDLPAPNNYIDVNVDNLNFETGIFINQKNKLQVVAGIHFRTYTSTANTNYIYVALRTPLSNIYNDF